MPTEFTIHDLRRIPSPDPQRMGKEDVLVTVLIEGGSYRIVRLPGEDFDEAKLKAAVKVQLAERAKWAGKKLSID